MQYTARKGENNMKKHLIWSDQLDEHFDAWKEDYKIENPNASDDEIIQAWYDYAAASFEDERANLAIPLEGPVLVIKKINRWDGPTFTSSLIHRDVVGDLLQRFFDGNSFYVEGKDLIGEAYHHDGTNYYCFRLLSADASNEDINDLMNRIHLDEPYEKDLQRLTKPLGDRIASIYGWDLSTSIQ